MKANKILKAEHAFTNAIIAAMCEATLKGVDVKRMLSQMKWIAKDTKIKMQKSRN